MPGIDIDNVLRIEDQVIFFIVCQLANHTIGTLEHQLKFFVLAGVQVLLKLAALALELSVLLAQLALA